MTAGVPSGLDAVWLGHSTVDLRFGGSGGGARVVTDPVLRDAVGHLRRRDGTGRLEPGPVSAAVVSHLHHDHCDLPSLRQLPHGTPVIVPSGSARLVARHAPGEVHEMRPGDTVVVDEVTITAVPASHHPGRFLRRYTAAPIGFVFECAGGDGTEGLTAYFPGDTDLHPVMSDLPRPHLALLPIWGWGPSIGPGHLDPRRAAEAARVLRAHTVLPVHWGTFSPVRLRPGPPDWLTRPASTFEHAMRRQAPETELRLVAPGGRLSDAT